MPRGQAVEAKDYGKLRETLRELKPLVPENPRIVYNLAAIVQRTEDNKKPVSRSSAAFALAERDLIPEDIAFDPKTRRFFISSVRKSKIITADGRDFAKTDWPVFALRLDAKRRLLWADEKTLYVPDYVRGIAAITLSSGAVTWTKPADDIALSGIDGLYFYRGSFLAVQNGTKPERIVRISGDLRKQENLETNTPRLGDPTHGTMVGDTFYFIANSGWDEYDGQGKKKTGSNPVESNIRKIALK